VSCSDLTFTGISQACVDAAAEHQRPVTVLPDGGTPRVPGRARPAPGSEQMRSAESTMDRLSLENRNAVVTGGSRGIGAIIAAALLTAGAHVTVVSRRPVEGDVVEELDGCGDWESIIGDLSTDAGRAHVTDAVLAVYDRLHVLVNNAGTTWGAPLADYPSAAFDKVLAVNLTAVFDLTRRLLPALTRAAKPDDPARVINIGSVDGIRVPPMQSYAYSSSKAALHALTRHIGATLVGSGIAVNTLAPGLFPTRMTRHMITDGAVDEDVFGSIPMGRIGRPEDIGDAAVFLASRAASYITGVLLPVDGGLTGLR
jgi:NAD(P)-dependent dehydrogenase (short-subunit alcohol dehydrogenase family)